MIQLPALILLGIPYHKALAVHKVATVALGLGGSLRNFSTLFYDLRIVSLLLAFGIPGVLLGTFMVSILSEDFLYLILGLFSIVLGWYSLKNPDFGIRRLEIKLNSFSYLRFIFLTFFIGILNGSVSSGTGLFVTILLIKTFGFDFLRAISITFFTVGIFWNASGAISLASMGSLELDILMFLIIGSFAGGFLGSHLSKIKGNILVKKFFTILCFSIGISILLKIFFS